MRCLGGRGVLVHSGWSTGQDSLDSRVSRPRSTPRVSAPRTAQAPNEGEGVHMRRCGKAVDTPRALMRSLSGSALVAFEAPSQTCTCRCASIQGSRARERSILGVAQVVVTLSKRGQLCLNLVGRQFCEFQVVVSHDTRLRARAPRNTREGALGRLLAPCKDDQCRAFPRRCANHAAPPSQSGRHSIQKGTQRRLRRVRRGAPSVRTSMSVAFKSEPRTFCMQARAS